MNYLKLDVSISIRGLHQKKLVLSFYIYIFLYFMLLANKRWVEFFPFLTRREDAVHVNKAVICVAPLVAAIITVHGLLSFLSDVYGLFDPSGKTLCRSPSLETSWWHGSLGLRGRWERICCVLLNLMYEDFVPLQSCVPVILTPKTSSFR